VLRGRDRVGLEVEEVEGEADVLGEFVDGAAEAGAIVQAADTDEGFGDALACVLADPVKARRLGEAGRAWVRNTLDWQALVTMVDRAYAEAGGVGADGASGDGRFGATRSR